MQGPEESVNVEETIDASWIEEALDKGWIRFGDRTYFFHRYPRSREDKVWLSDTYGLPVPGPDGEGFLYHGTKVDDLVGLIKEGVCGIPDNPTISTVSAEQVSSTAHSKSRDSSLKYGIIAIFRAPWSKLEFDGTGWPEPISWPKDEYEGDREGLPDHLKGSDDLRCLSSRYLIGFYLVEHSK